MDVVNFCGINFRCLDREQLFQAPEKGETRFIVTVNAEFIVRASCNRKFLKIINDNHATFDGQIPYAFARLINPGQQFDKISGSDLLYEACLHAQNQHKRIFLLGGDGTVNTCAVSKIRTMYGINVAGYAPPYATYPFSSGHNQAILEQIRLFKPDILFVGFGIIKQEYWIHDNLEFLQQQGVKLVIGCGGAFDFMAGKVKRAPRFLQKSGLEGVWRFVVEPKPFRLKRLLLSTRFFAVFYNYHVHIVSSVVGLMKRKALL